MDYVFDYEFLCTWCVFRNHNRHVGTYNYVNISPANGLLPDGAKPLSQPMLNYHH